MDLRESIIKQKPRDNSGSRSANRFDYQKNWALCKLLELHLENKDYLLIFEHHDDIIILDSEVNPQKVEFYQVKTKDHSEWTLNDLIYSYKAKQNKIPSILSKMYINKLNFPSNTESMNLVSNQKFNIKLKKSKGTSNNKNNICILDVDSVEVKKIVENLKNDLELTEDPKFDDITFLNVSNMGIHSPDSYAMGEIVRFLDKIDPHGKHNVATIYRALLDEIRIRNNYEWEVVKLSELIEKKSISSRYFSGMISSICRKCDLDEIWANNINSRLQNEGETIPKAIKIREQWKRYEVERMQCGSNDTLLKIKNRIIEIIKQDYENESLRLRDRLYKVLDNYKASKPCDDSIYSEDYIKAIILMEYCLYEEE